MNENDEYLRKLIKHGFDISNIDHTNILYFPIILQFTKQS